MGILKENFEEHPKLQPLLNTDNTNKNKIQPTEETIWNRRLYEKKDNVNNQIMNQWNNFIFSVFSLFPSLMNSNGTAVQESLTQEHFTSSPMYSFFLNDKSGKSVLDFSANRTDENTTYEDEDENTTDENGNTTDRYGNITDKNGNTTDRYGNKIKKTKNESPSPSNIKFALDTANSPKTYSIYYNSKSVFFNTFSKLDRMIPIMNAFFQKVVFYLAKNYVKVFSELNDNDNDNYIGDRGTDISFVAEMFFTMILLPFCLIFSYNWFFLLCYSQIFNPEKNITEGAINISNTDFYKKNIVPLSEWYILRYLFESPFAPLMWLDYFLLTFVVRIIKDMVNGIGYLLLYYAIFFLFSWLLLDSLLNKNLESRSINNDNEDLMGEIDENVEIGYSLQYNGFYAILKIICMALIIVSGVMYIFGDFPDVLTSYPPISIFGTILLIFIILIRYIFRILINISDPFLVISVFSVILYLFIYSFLAIPLYTGLDYQNFTTVKQYISLFLQYNGEYDIKKGEFKKERTCGKKQSQKLWCVVKLCMSIFFSHNSFLTLIIIFCITLIIKNFAVVTNLQIKFFNFFWFGLITGVMLVLKFRDAKNTFINEWAKVESIDTKDKTFWEGIREGIIIILGPFSGPTG